MDVFPDRTVIGGAPFNVARHLRGFGMHPLLISRTGNEMLREQILKTMLRMDMDVSGMQTDPLHPTGQVSVYLTEGQAQFQILDNQAYDFIDPIITKAVGSKMQPLMLYFGTLAQRHEISRRALTALLKTSDTPKLLDLNLRKPWYETQTLRRSFERAHIAKMSEEELAAVTKSLRLQGLDERARVAELITRFDLEYALVTCGPKGAWLMDKAGKVTEEPALPLQGKIADTVGAGDAFAAVFMLGQLLGWSASTTLARANSFSAAVCQIRGAIPESQNFYTPFLQEWELSEESFAKAGSNWLNLKPKDKGGKGKEVSP